MKTIKSVIAVFLSVSICVTLFAGCKRAMFTDYGDAVNSMAGYWKNKGVEGFYITKEGKVTSSFDILNAMEVVFEEELKNSAKKSKSVDLSVLKNLDYSVWKDRLNSELDKSLNNNEHGLMSYYELTDGNDYISIVDRSGRRNEYKYVSNDKGEQLYSYDHKNDNGKSIKELKLSYEKQSDISIDEYYQNIYEDYIENNAREVMLNLIGDSKYTPNKFRKECLTGTRFENYDTFQSANEYVYKEHNKTYDETKEDENNVSFFSSTTVKDGTFGKEKFGKDLLSINKDSEKVRFGINTNGQYFSEKDLIELAQLWVDSCYESLNFDIHISDMVEYAKKHNGNDTRNPFMCVSYKSGDMNTFITIIPQSVNLSNLKNLIKN